MYSTPGLTTGPLMISTARLSAVADWNSSGSSLDIAAARRYGRKVLYRYHESCDLFPAGMHRAQISRPVPVQTCQTSSIHYYCTLDGRHLAGCANGLYAPISRRRIANRRWPSSRASCLLTMLPRTQAPTSPRRLLIVQPYTGIIKSCQPRLLFGSQCISLFTCVIVTDVHADRVPSDEELPSRTMLRE